MWLTSSWAGVWELPTTLPLKDVPTLLTGQPTKLQWPQLSQPRHQSPPWWQSSPRAMCGWDIVGAVILGGGLLFEEVRPRSHMRRSDEGTLSEHRKLRACFSWMSNKTYQWPQVALPKLSSLSSLPQELSECGRLSPGLPDATEWVRDWHQSTRICILAPPPPNRMCARRRHSMCINSLNPHTTPKNLVTMMLLFLLAPENCWLLPSPWPSLWLLPYNALPSQLSSCPNCL